MTGMNFLIKRDEELPPPTTTRYKLMSMIGLVVLWLAVGILVDASPSARLLYRPVGPWLLGAGLVLGWLRVNFPAMFRMQV